MSARYKLVIKSKLGVKREETTDSLSLVYHKRVNQPGLLSFTLSGNHRILPALEEDGQIEVWRANPALGLDWYPDFVGLLQGHTYDTKDTTIYRGNAPGLLSILGRRVVAWPASATHNARTNFITTKAETVMKTLVRYNATADATTGRDVSGVFASWTITNATDTAAGNTISHTCPRKNLLTELQKIAEVAGGDFDLVRIGPAAFQFRFYPGQLGTDKSASVVFSLARGNMKTPSLTVTPAKHTVAIVGGEGQQDIRSTVVVGTPGDGSEVFLDARSLSADQLTARGNLALTEAAATQEFSFAVMQTPTCYYGLHYGVGDLVQAKYMGLDAKRKIVGVTVELGDNGEEIDCEIE